MVFLVLILAFLLPLNGVTSIDLNSALGRTNCYRNEQLNCNEEFIDAYPHLSKSANNLTDADTYFLLFTRRNKDAPEKLHKCGGRLPPTTHFSPNQELIVVVHPFISGFCNTAVYREWIYQILKRGNYNVLAVDYSWGNLIDYGTAILNIKIVAKQTVIVLNNIQERTKIKNNAISIVGHSLGGQLAGLIGKDFHVKKITALDPAGPGFDARLIPADDRLDMSDADFVEVWNCGTGKCLPDLGSAYEVGHVNIYINGGEVQKGCQKYAIISLAKRDWIYGLGTALFPNICSHAHCAQYYKVSINPGNCEFVAVKCESYSDFNSGKCKCGRNGQNCIIVGFDTEKYIESSISSPQRYYLNTTETCPYCDQRPFYLE